MPQPLDPGALKYDSQGLIVAIVQDAASHEVVMVGYMNEHTLRQTLEVGQAVFWSRSRQEVWHKGATSGDYIEVLSIATDCDSDALLIQGRLLGSGVCHTGSRSCFVDVEDGATRLVSAAPAATPAASTWSDPRSMAAMPATPGGASRPPYRVSLIVFDIDGTLIDFVGALRVALAAAAEHASTLTSAVVTPEVLQRALQTVRAESEWRGRPQSDMRLESFRRVLEAGEQMASGERMAEDAIGSLGAAYTRARDQALTVYPDVRAALEELRARGFELRAASNGNMDLGAVGLDRYFAATDLAERLGVSKPDPRFYAEVVARAGVAPAAALAVGDRVDNDYEPARAAGLHALLVDRAGALDGGLPRVRALTEVAALVELA